MNAREEKRRAVRLILVIIALATWAIVPVFGADMTLATGDVLKDAEVIDQSGDSLHVMHRYGITRVPAENLTAEQKAAYRITDATVLLAREARAEKEARGREAITAGQALVMEAQAAALAAQVTRDFTIAMQKELERTARPAELRVVFKMEGGVIAEIMEPAVARFSYGMASIGGGNKPKANNIGSRGSGRLVYLAGADREPGSYLRGRFRRDGDQEITFPGLEAGRYMARWAQVK